MDSRTLYIKNMVCNRCIKVVSNELTGLGYEIKSIELGKVDILSNESFDMETISDVLQGNGFELIDDRKSRVIEAIKTEIIRIIHHKKEIPAHMNLSQHLERELGHDYSYLSNLFSSTEGLTIEKYVIFQKVEKIKELLVYDELSLNEIADQMGYSSVQYLSSQFKKATGLTPSHFKQIGEKKRKPLDKM